MDVIFDLDGTLADCSHRLHFIQTKPKNWNAFFTGMANDKPIVPTVTLAQNLHEGGHRLIFCTGRPIKHHGETQSWLRAHLGDWSIDRPLFMRPFQDHRADDVLKEDLLDEMRQFGFRPVMAFEDRLRVVEMWRRNGLICCHVADGNF